MFSKRLPLIIAAVGLIAIASLFAWNYFQNKITPRTVLSLTPENLAALSLPSEANILNQTDPGNAGDIYATATTAFPVARIDCEKFASDPTSEAPKIISQILSAQHKSCSAIFASHPGSIINYDSDRAVLDNLEELGKTIDRAGLTLRLRKQPDQAKNYFLSVYALGQGLYRERLVYDEYLKGMGLMNESAQGLSELEPADSPRARDLLQQSTARLDYDTAHVRPIYTILSSIDPQVIAANAGDVFAFATESRERMFRIEAILKLGRYCFDAARSADQLAAPSTLQKLTSDPDPTIQAAAQAALNLTLEQYRTIH